MSVNFHSKQIKDKKSDKSNESGIEKRGSDSSDNEIVGNQKIRLPYNGTKARENLGRRLHKKPHDHKISREERQKKIALAKGKLLFHGTHPFFYKVILI